MSETRNLNPRWGEFSWSDNHGTTVWPRRPTSAAKTNSATYPFVRLPHCITAVPSPHDGQQSHVICQVYSIDARAVNSFHSTLGVHGVAHNAGVPASLDWRVSEACLCTPASRRLRFLTQTAYQPNQCAAWAVCELCNMRRLKKPCGWRGGFGLVAPMGISAKR